MVSPLDTYETVKKLRKAGFSEKQAEAQTSILASLVEEQLATKVYLDAKLRELEYRLLLRLGGMLAATAGLIVGLVKFLK